MSANSVKSGVLEDLPWLKIRPQIHPGPPQPLPQMFDLETDSEADSDATNPPFDLSSEDAGETPPPPAFQVKVEKHTAAGFDYGKGKTIVDEIDEDQFADERRNNRYYPFASRDDFEVGAWFIRSSVSMSDIDKFLKLPAVSA